MLIITFLKKDETKFDFLDSILDYKLYRYNLKKLLIFYPKLLTIDVKLKLTDYQGFENTINISIILTFIIIFFNDFQSSYTNHL
jgi:hypothetical protein